MKVTITQTNREVDYSRQAHSGAIAEVVETYRVNQALARKFAVLADGGEVNGDTSYGVFNVYKEGKSWFAQWALETYEEDPESIQFDELMSGHIRWDIGTALGLAEDSFCVNWRGIAKKA